MDKTKVIIMDRQKVVKIPTGIRLLIRRCCNAVLQMEKISGPCEVCVSFVDTEEIQKLNAEYRHHDYVTDVLSFPLGIDGTYDINPATNAKQLGDIVLCVPVAVDQAKKYGHSLQREIGYLTAHSMLHLLGYDHEQGGIEAVRMREKEETVMVSLGLPRDGSYVPESHDDLN